MLEPTRADLLRVPPPDAGVLDTGTVTDRLDGGYAAITDTSQVTGQPRYSSDISGTPHTQREDLADRALYEYIEDVARNLVARFGSSNFQENLIDTTRVLHELVRDTMDELLGPGWLYGIAAQIAGGTDDAAAKIQIINQLRAVIDVEALGQSLLSDPVDDPDPEEWFPEDADTLKWSEQQYFEEIARYVEAARNFKRPPQEVSGVGPLTIPIDPTILGCAAEYTTAKIIAGAAGPDLPSDKALGSLVHMEIQADYVARMPPSPKVLERVVSTGKGKRWGTLSALIATGPIAAVADLPFLELVWLDMALATTAWSKTRQKWTNVRLRPDIVDFFPGFPEVYEIKPRRSLPDAVLQIYGYIYAWNQINDPMRPVLRPGIRFRPLPVYPAGPNHFARAYLLPILPGIIGYELYKAKRPKKQKVEQKVPAPSPEARRVMLLVAAGIVAAAIIVVAWPTILAGGAAIGTALGGAAVVKGLAAGAATATAAGLILNAQAQAPPGTEIGSAAFDVAAMGIGEGM